MEPAKSESYNDIVLSVVIPAYNEADTIKENLNRIMNAPFNKEIIVVDDGSRIRCPS